MVMAAISRTVTLFQRAKGSAGGILQPVQQAPEARTARTPFSWVAGTPRKAAPSAQEFSN